LFVQEYLLPETADFIHQQLASLSPIRVIIAPGEKDPYTNDSPYARLNWPENVDIFYQNKLTPLALATNLHLWGACNPPARGAKLLDGFHPAKGTNILLLHALRGRSSNDVYTFSSEEVRRAGFNLALLGGEHTTDIAPIEQPFHVFPGSPEPLSPFEEDGLHREAFVDIEDEVIRVQVLSLQQWHYLKAEVNITNCVSNAEAAHCIDVAMEAVIAKKRHSAVKVTLVGNPLFNLDVTNVQQLVQTSVFYNLECNLGINYDLEQLAGEQTVRGLLVQRFLARIHSAASDSERCQQKTALNFALQALEGKQVDLYETKTN